jgi:hypothetical protein
MVLRAAGRAGLVTGYEHRCTKRGCRRRETRTTSDLAFCPKCGRALSPKPIAKGFNFRHLRHTHATALLKRGESLALVQDALRHSDPDTTKRIYGHLDLEDRRRALSGLTFRGSPGPEGLVAAPVSPASADGKSEFLCAPFVRTPENPQEEGPEADRFREQPRGLQRVGATGFEPATTCTPSPSRLSVNVGGIWQLFARRGDSGLGPVDAFARIRRVSLES